MKIRFPKIVFLHQYVVSRPFENIFLKIFITEVKCDISKQIFAQKTSGI